MLRVVLFILLPLWLAASGAAGQEALSRAEVVRLQEALSEYDAGSADGVWGPASAAALRAYEADWGLPQDGTPTRDRLDRLERRHAATRPLWRPAGAGCEVWIRYPGAQGRATWTGGCAGGRAAGDGRLTLRGVFRGEAQESVYDGGMAAGKVHGRGVYRDADGDVYEGDWIDDKRTGRGVLRWANGNSYVGGFDNDRAHGQGTYVAANGTVWSGLWTFGCHYDGRGGKVAIGRASYEC